MALYCDCLKCVFMLHCMQNGIATANKAEVRQAPLEWHSDELKTKTATAPV